LQKKKNYNGAGRNLIAHEMIEWNSFQVRMHLHAPTQKKGRMPTPHNNNETQVKNKHVGERIQTKVRITAH